MIDIFRLQLLLLLMHPKPFYLQTAPTRGYSLTLFSPIMMMMGGVNRISYFISS